MAPKGTGPREVVRPYASDDLEACRGLWVELTMWHRDLYETLDIGGEEPGRLFDAHLERVGEENVWVAERGGEVVGLAGLIPAEGEPELEPLVVTERSRGRGIGRRLAEAVVREARARGARFLRVRPTARNHDALRVFHRLGFDILGHIELLMDFRGEERQRWEAGPRLADRDFRS